MLVQSTEEVKSLQFIVGFKINHLFVVILALNLVLHSGKYILLTSHTLETTIVLDDVHGTVQFFHILFGEW